MNYLIISDIHGSHKRLEEVLETPLIYDGVILVGDSLYHGPRNPILDDYNPSSVADILNAITENRIMQIENLTGQMQASQSQYEQVLDFIQKGDYSQYYSQLPDGTIAFDITKWYNEGGSDEMGDALGEMATKGNDAIMQILESQQKISSIQDEQQKE